MCNMRDFNRQNARNRQKKRPGLDAPESSADTSVDSYTPQQQRTIRKGLRILAKVAVRAHMRRNAAHSEDGGESEG